MSDNCSNCNAELQADEMQKWAGSDGNPIYLCKKCIAEIEKTYFEQTQNPNLFLALLYGIGASIVTGLIWYTIIVLTHTAIDLIVIGIGFCIAYAVCKGAGDKRGWKLQVITVILTLLTFIVADGMTGYHQLATQEGMNTFQYFIQDGLIGIIVKTILLPKYAIAVTGFIGYICWAVGIYVAFVYTAPEKLIKYKEKQQ